MLTLLLLSQRASGALCSRAGWEFCSKLNLQWKTSTFSWLLIRRLCCLYMRSFYHKLSISTFTLIWQWVQKVCHFKFCLSFLQLFLPSTPWNSEAVDDIWELELTSFKKTSILLMQLLLSNSLTWIFSTNLLFLEGGRHFYRRFISKNEPCINFLRLLW